MTPTEFDQCYRRYVHDMERVAGRALRTHPDLVGEAVAQATITLWEACESLDPSLARATFTYSAYWPARKMLLYAKRDETKSLPLDGISLEDTERHLSRLGVQVEWSPEQAAEAERDEVTAITLDQERLGQLRHAVMSLPSQQRKVIEAIYFRGLTQTQAAVELDVTLGEVKSWRQKGVERLRRLFNHGELARNGSPCS